MKPGFLVLTVKPDETGRWVRLCRESGRSCLLFGPGSGFSCDILNYELSRSGATIESSAQLLDMLVGVSARHSQGKGDEPFWAHFSQRILRRAIGAAFFGTGKCSLTDVYRIITSAPESVEQLKSVEWHQRSFLAQCIFAGTERVKSVPAIERDFHLCADFWQTEWPGLSEKTRSVGYTMTTNVLDKFLSGPVADLVSSGRSNLTPDDVLGGAVVVADMPVLQWREPGQFVQILLKALVQRAALRRKNAERPVVIWADEAQFFVVPEADVMTQTVARQAKLISVALTQNLPMLYAAMGGGEAAVQQVDGWIANHSTKILCANACKQTNEYFSELLGYSRQMFMNGSTQFGDYSQWDDAMGNANGMKASGGFSEQWHPDVPPTAFTTLRKGGVENNLTVDAFVFQGGRRYAVNRGRTWVQAEFRQQNKGGQ